jgi:hypothetical protein
VLLAIGQEDEPVIAQAPPEHAGPIIALKAFHIALKWIGLHLS